VLNGALALTATVAIASYAVKFQTARGYVVIALPCATVFDLVIRHRLRKRLHMLRSKGACMRKVVAVGHAPAVADLVGELLHGEPARGRRHHLQRGESPGQRLRTCHGLDRPPCESKALYITHTIVRY